MLSYYARGRYRSRFALKNRFLVRPPTSEALWEEYACVRERWGAIVARAAHGSDTEAMLAGALEHVCRPERGERR